MNLYGIFRPLAFRLDAERAHRATIAALRWMPPHRPPELPASLRTQVAGLDFHSPLGLAAGFDKDAEVPDQMLSLGFGFVEVGTITPRAQSGNPKPRLFRLDADQAVINRLGFNNDGAAAVHARLAARQNTDGILGVNIGANRDSVDRAEDYVRLVETFAAVASYFTVNVSSPNTPGLRDLQQAKALDDLLARVLDARERNRFRAGVTPVLLKIAPDVTLSDLDDIVGVARRRRVDGMIVGNTTVTRPTALRERERAREQGGLSGRPLFKLSTRMLAETFVRAEGAFPLIGVGGIDSGATAIAKVKAGATLLQLYTGMVYRGIGVVNEIKTDLAAAIKRGYRNSLASMIGNDAATITAESWPG